MAEYAGEEDAPSSALAKPEDNSISQRDVIMLSAWTENAVASATVEARPLIETAVSLISMGMCLN